MLVIFIIILNMFEWFSPKMSFYLLGLVMILNIWRNKIHKLC